MTTRRTVQQTELWHDAPELAESLWRRGFRPVLATDVVLGDRVVSFDADFMGDGHGDPHGGYVDSIDYDEDEACVTSGHTAAPADFPTEVDEGADVWVQVTRRKRLCGMHAESAICHAEYEGDPRPAIVPDEGNCDDCNDVHAAMLAR